MHNAPTDVSDGGHRDRARHRAIRSFVRRQGRLTEGQQRALDSQWDRLGLDLLGQPRDLDTLFGRAA
jgi:tRNA (guanine-N7-)-methyltransferase